MSMFVPRTPGVLVQGPFEAIQNGVTICQRQNRFVQNFRQAWIPKKFRIIIKINRKNDVMLMLIKAVLSLEDRIYGNQESHGRSHR